MPERHTAKQLAEISELVRYERHRNGLLGEDILEFEYRRGTETGILKRIRFGRNPTSGRPTKNIIDCIDNGFERSYDGKYDFEVSAFMVAGQKLKEL